MSVSSVPPALLATLDGYQFAPANEIGDVRPVAAGLDTATADEWQTHLSEVLARVGGWHARPTAADAELVRYGVAHLHRGSGQLEERLARCATRTGPYFVCGVGWRFWAAAASETDPDRLPRWCPNVLAGCVRLGTVSGRSGDDLAGSFAAVAATYQSVRSARPDVTAARLDRFFRAVSLGHGREPGAETADVSQHLRHELRALRSVTPLKRRVAVPAPTDPAELLQTVAAAVGEPATSVPASATDWYALLDPVASVDDLLQVVERHPWLSGDGFWLSAGVMHLRQPRRFPPWSATIAASQTALDDAIADGMPVAERYRLLVRLGDALRERFRVHPLEVGDLLSRAVVRRSATPAAGQFGGFSGDTFRFLAALASNNTAAWMAAARGRYRHAVRTPLLELSEALAARYVLPVLVGEYGWDVETDARPGKVLSSVNSNDFGRSGPYQPVLWLTFYRRPGHKRTAAQLFVRLAADGLSAGFRLARSARADGRRFRANVQAHGQLLFDALVATGGAGLGFAADHDADGQPLRSAADLREWASNKDVVAGVCLAPAEAVRRTDELVGEAILAFDRLVPLFAAAVEDDPRPILSRRAGRPDGGGFDRAAFREATLLGEPWLDRAVDLLQAKRQLVLQGVPGTGKTHVARSLARHLTGGRADLVSTVQFHPAYSYEEFVEGIRPKAEGYGVEPGLLLRVAEHAARHPADPHVLVIDEINRGNLPRVFGELLYLLEYRDQEVTLPYSKAGFRLPPNLHLIATLNPADRSVTALDQATRRRFAFLDMPPDPAVLSRWLARHPPADPDPEFGGRLVKWFESLNRRLARDFGPDRQVGHTYWLRERITHDLVRTIWEHEVRPTLADLFAGRADRLDALDPARAVAAAPPRRRPLRGAVR